MDGDSVESGEGDDTEVVLDSDTETDEGGAAEAGGADGGAGGGVYSQSARGAPLSLDRYSHGLPAADGTAEGTAEGAAASSSSSSSVSSSAKAQTSCRGKNCSATIRLTS